MRLLAVAAAAFDSDPAGSSSARLKTPARRRAQARAGPEAPRRPGRDSQWAWVAGAGQAEPGDSENAWRACQDQSGHGGYY